MSIDKKIDKYLGEAVIYKKDLETHKIIDGIFKDIGMLKNMQVKISRSSEYKNMLNLIRKIYSDIDRIKEIENKEGFEQVDIVFNREMNIRNALDKGRESWNDISPYDQD